MPRLIEPREKRPSGRERRFADVARVLQLQEGIQAPQREQAALEQRGSQGNVQAALQLLGLTQQASEGALSRAEDARRTAAMEEATKERGASNRLQNLVDASRVASTPGAPPAVLKALALAFPELAQGQGKVQQEALQKGIQTMEPQVRAVYGSGTSPAKMQPMLDALKASNPEAFNALPWDVLNATLGGAPPPDEGFLASREGGVLSPILPKTPEEAQKNRANIMGMQLGLQPGQQGISVLDLLFGKKKPQPIK